MITLSPIPLHINSSLPFLDDRQSKKLPAPQQLSELSRPCLQTVRPFRQWKIAWRWSSSSIRTICRTHFLGEKIVFLFQRLSLLLAKLDRRLGPVMALSMAILCVALTVHGLFHDRVRSSLTEFIANMEHEVRLVQVIDWRSIPSPTPNPL